jgi:hypothetical protein
LSGTALLLAIIIPVLAVAGFGTWIGIAFYPGSHPRTGHPAEPLKHTVQGGAFQGSGRQLMPRRDATPPEASDH